MRYIHLIWIGICFYANPYHSQAQNRSQNLDLVQKYQKSFPKAPAVILESVYTYEFRFADKSKSAVTANEPMVYETGTDRMLSLKSRESILRYKFYDDNSELESYKCFGNNNQRIDLIKNCGNHQVDGVFHTDAKICQFPLKFNTIGEIQSLRVDKVFKNVRYFTTVYFHDVLPVASKTVKIVVPKGIKIEIKKFNFEGFQISENQYPGKDQTTQIYEYHIENTVPIEAEEHSPGPSHTYPHILVIPQSYTNEASVEKNILSTTKDLYQWYASLIKELQPETAAIRAKVDELTQNLSDPKEKIKAIYYWVQDNIRYIAFEDGIAGFRPEEAHQVLHKKYGDCKGMANLTKEMLKIAGFDARLTWIGTDRLVYDYSTPSLVVDNHMVCTVFLNDKKYILDATEKCIALGDNAERIQGRPIMIENDADFILDQVPLSDPSRNLVAYNLDLFIEEDKLRGKGIIHLNGEAKTAILYGLNSKQNLDQKDILKSLFEGSHNNTTINQIDYSEVANRDQAFSISYDITTTDQFSIFGNEIYVGMDPFQNLIGYTVKEDRVSDLDLGEKYAIKTRVVLYIPEGYQVDYLPKPLLVEEKGFQFKVSFEQAEKQIIYQKEILVPERRIRKADLSIWNQAIAQLKKTYENQIILKRL